MIQVYFPAPLRSYFFTELFSLKCRVHIGFGDRIFSQGSDTASVLHVIILLSAPQSSPTPPFLQQASKQPQKQSFFRGWIGFVKTTYLLCDSSTAAPDPVDQFLLVENPRFNPVKIQHVQLKGAGSKP